jgi:asparagine synthase (glutamine-hydrolysing)
MSEPMVSHDCVAFYLLSEDVSASVKVVQSGQGADEVLGGYDWYPAAGRVPRDQRSRRTRACSSTALAGDERVLEPNWLLEHDAPPATSPSASASRARRPPSTRRCATTPW